MNLRSRFLMRAIAGVAVLAAGPVLTGCSGVVKNLNSAQVNVPNVNVANPFGLDQQTASVTVSNPVIDPPKALQAHGISNVNTFSFPNQTPVGLADIKSAQVSFNLVPKVTLTGTGLPTAFTLTTFTVNGTVSDTASSVMLTQVATSGPIHFTQQADGSYTADSGTFQLAQSTKTTDTQLQSLLNIVTGGPTPNTATLTLNATSPDLPNGTVLTITFDSTTLTVSASA
jgi:hypothetical protein